MLKITSKIFRTKKDETFSALLKRVNKFIAEKYDSEYSLDKVIVNEKLIVEDYWKEQEKQNDGKNRTRKMRTTT